MESEKGNSVVPKDAMYRGPAYGMASRRLGCRGRRRRAQRKIL